MKNEAVAQAWKEGRKAKSYNGNYRTDGKKLFSYRLPIGDTIKGKKVLYDFRRKVSCTTSLHCGLAMDVADIIKEPTEKQWR